MSAIDYRAVEVTYPGEVLALRGVDLGVEPGEIVVVTGASGSGKSTLLRAANGLVPHSTGGRLVGDVVTGGRSVRDNRPRDFADIVGFVHQDPEAQFVVDRVEADVAFVLENLGVAPPAMRRRVEEVLDALGIAHLRHRRPDTLSGGERQRAAIAGALAAGPEVLVLDEPTSQLDPQGSQDLVAALRRLNADLGTTVVLAEHRLGRAGPLADRVVIMDAGRVGRDGPPDRVLADYAGAAPVTRLGRLLGWQPAPLTVRDARRHAREQRVPRPAEQAPTGRVGTRQVADRPAPGEVLLAVDGLNVRVGARPVLEGVELTVRQGEVLAVMGRNGSGKTSLLRALCGLLEPEAGDIHRSGRVAYVPQDPNRLLSAASVRDELEQTLRLLGERDPAAVDRLLKTFELDELAGRHPRRLSAGQRQRVAIAAVAVGGAEVLALDEPTRGMDAAATAALEAVLSRHTAAGGGAVVATHDVELAARLADHVLVLGDGDVVAAGDTRTVLSGSLFAPQILRVVPPFLTVEEVAHAVSGTGRP